MNEFQIEIINVYMLFQYYKKMTKAIDIIDNRLARLDKKRSYYLNIPQLQSEEFEKKYTTRKLTKKEINEKVNSVIKIVGLEGAEAKFPSDLSGGMQQRVALARAIVIEPEILLLDEPLSALDAKVRQQMRLELKSLHQKLKLTFILVTHDQEEALFLSNKIIVMANGSTIIITDLLTKNGLISLYHGSIADGVLTLFGHYPWFVIHNYLNNYIPKFNNNSVKNLIRNASIGFISSLFSDTITNSFRVIKTTKQTDKSNKSYYEIGEEIIKKNGFIGLIFRGLETRILTNGIQGLMFNILWKYFDIP